MDTGNWLQSRHVWVKICPRIFARKEPNQFAAVSAELPTLVSMGRSVSGDGASCPIRFRYHVSVPGGFPTFPRHSMVAFDFSWNGPGGASMIGGPGVTDKSERSHVGVAKTRRVYMFLCMTSA